LRGRGAGFFRREGGTEREVRERSVGNGSLSLLLLLLLLLFLSLYLPWYRSSFLSLSLFLSLYLSLTCGWYLSPPLKGPRESSCCTR